MADREVVEGLSEVYSIILVLDLVEKLYLKDGLISKSKDLETNEDVTIDDYTPTVLRLLNQYNMILKDQQILAEFQDLATFKAKYKINCPLASRRIEVGVPSTMETSVLKQEEKKKANESAAGVVSSRAVAEATGCFITLMDALKLNYKAKDQLHPLLSDLITSINQVLGDDDSDEEDGDTTVSGEPRKIELESKGKLIEWLVKLNAMNVDQELSAEDIRLFLFDLEAAYKNFYTCLE